MINRLISSERAKWIFVIGVVAISSGLAANTVIYYSTECISEELVQDFVSHKVTTRNFTI